MSMEGAGANRPWRLIACRGCGSAIVEAMLDVAGLPYRVDDVAETALGPDGDLARGGLNPLGQVPVLVLPDGTVMTESAAIALHIGDQAPAAGLVPPPDAATRPSFLRWLIVLVAAIYPTFTYADDPARWVSGAEAQAEAGARIMAQRQALWRMVEAHCAPGPWFLGAEGPTAVDLYIAVMTRWRPRRAWFAAECPRLHAVAQAADRLPAVAAAWARNFNEARPTGDPQT